jgi:hypothetical protein
LTEGEADYREAKYRGASCRGAEYREAEYQGAGKLCSWGEKSNVKLSHLKKEVLGNEKGIK